MGKVSLDDIEKFEDEYNVEKFKKKKQSNPNKKHSKLNKKHRINTDVE